MWAGRAGGIGMVLVVEWVAEAETETERGELNDSLRGGKRGASEKAWRGAFEAN